MLLTFLSASFILIQSTNLDAQWYDPIKKCVVDPNGECIPNTILSAMPFLRIIPDARGGGMGDAGIAVSPDANAMFYNASNLVYVEQDMALSATYTPWLRELNLNDIYLAYLSGFKKIDDLQTVGLGLKFFNLGEINFTDEMGTPLGTGKPREFEIAASYARKLGPKLSAGLTGKYVHSNLATGEIIGGQEISSANSFAADISLTYRTKMKMADYNGSFAMGLAFSNIGSKVTYTENIVKDFLPANMGLGAALTLDFDDFNTMTFALDINKLLLPSPISPSILVDGIPEPNPEFDKDGNGIADYREKSLFSGLFGSFVDAQGGFSEEIKEYTYSFGVEYWYDKQFAVRAGYYYENPEKGDRQYLTVGLGLKYNVFGIDLSYLVPTNNRRNPLDNTLRFSLLFDFDQYQKNQELELE